MYLQISSPYGITMNGIDCFGDKCKINSTYLINQSIILIIQVKFTFVLYESQPI